MTSGTLICHTSSSTVTFTGGNGTWSTDQDGETCTVNKDKSYTCNMAG
jgi:hypothetical protein